ncbi:T9SS type A sorting domain-containing protein [Oscillatoria amoena NRMC-F 0135]|nr:T9SS type A sorting domain-containing protein [Oscillatoria amoena NRMC-F 0135]
MKKLSLLLFIFFASGSVLFADHVLGSQLEFKSLGNRKYLTTLTAYRDCNSIQIGAGKLTAKCNTGTLTFTLTLVSTTDITGINNTCGVSSRCSGSFSYGFEKRVYEGVIDLNSLSCCEVTVSWDQCCRSTSITTGAQGSNYYTEAKINTCVPSSFEWSKIDPIFLLNVGTDQILNFSAQDPTDKDSISYELIVPQSAQGADVAYGGSFSAQKPITFLGFPNAGLNNPAGFKLDAVRGNLAFRPAKQNEVTVISVEATEWRRIAGTPSIIGKYRKEITVFVEQSSVMGSNRPPVQKGSGLYAACSGDTGIAVIEINENNTNQVLTLNLQHNLKWASAKLLGGAYGRTVFVRYLTDSMPIDGIDNAFTLEVKDDACPVIGRTIKTYSLQKIDTLIIDSATIKKSSSCGKAYFSLNNRNPSTLVKYIWEISANGVDMGVLSDSVAVALKDTGWVKAQVWVSAGCRHYKYVDSIYVSNLEIVKVNAGRDTMLCGGAAVTMAAKPVFGKPPYTYQWSNGATTDTTTIIPILHGRNYMVAMTDSNGCVSKDTLFVNYISPTITLSGNKAVCKNDSFVLSASFYGTANPSFGWKGFTANTLQIKTAITTATTFVFEVQDSGCLFKDSMTVLSSAPTLTYQHDSVYCIGDTMTLTVTALGGVPPYTIYWDTYSLVGNPIQVTTKNSAAGYTNFTTRVSDSIMCTAAISGRALLKPAPVVTLSKLPAVCITTPTINLATAATPTGGFWNGNGVIAGNFSPSAAGAGLHYLQYDYTDPITGCSNTTKTFQRVINPPIINFTTDSTTVIKGSTLQFVNQSTADTSFTNKWVFGLPKTILNTKTDKDPKFTFADTGLFTVKLVINDGVCEPDSVIKTNYIRVSQLTNIGLIAGKPEALKIYPNPATNHVWLALPKGENIAVILLTNIMGKEIKNIEVIGDRLLLPDLNTGVYMLRVFTDAKKAYSGSIIIE